MLSKKVEAICIDLDQTLIDSYPSLFKAYVKFLLVQGKQADEGEFQSLNGIPIFEMLPILKKRHDLHLPLEELQTIYKNFIEEEYLESPLIDGAYDFLKWAKSQNIPLALVTSSREEWVGPILGKLKIGHFFDTIVTRDRVKQGKPFPDPYLLAVDELEVNSANSYAIDDAEIGLQSAISAGLITLQFVPNPPFPPGSGNWATLKAFFIRFIDAIQTN